MKKKDTLYYTNQRRKARNGIPKEGVKEDASTNIKELFNQSAVIANGTTVGNAKVNFLIQQNKNIADIIKMPQSKFISYFDDIKNILVKRGYTEISYYEGEKNRVKQLNREDAINELLKSMKLVRFQQLNSL